VVELLFGKVAAAHPRAHEAIARVHRHEARLEHCAALTAPELPIGERLQLRHLTRDRLDRGLLKP
jgi:hypothetical protein